MKNVLITGGAGFIGFHLAQYLQGRGYKLTLVENFALGSSDRYFKSLVSSPNVELIEADLTLPESWQKLGVGYDHVYHLAAINSTKLFYEIPQEILRVGIQTTLNALEWFRTNNSQGKILFTSSNEAYGGALEAFGKLPLPTPENVPLVIADTYNPRWSYAGSKLIGELLFINYARAYNLRMSIVRPHNFYGPRAAHHVIPDVLGRIQKQEDPFVVYGATDTRSFCYIGDAIEAMVKVMESDATDGNTYHIGSATETKIGELIEQLFALNNWTPNEKIYRSSPDGSPVRRLPDVSKIKADVGWEAMTSLEDGLKKTVEWFQSEKNRSTV